MNQGSRKQGWTGWELVRRVGVAVLAAWSPAAIGQDAWGTASGGNAQRNGLVDTVGPDEAVLAWEGTDYPNQFGASEFAAGEGKVFLDRTFDAGNPVGGSILLAYDLETGQELWNRSLPLDGVPIGDAQANRVVGYDGGRVYALRAGVSRVGYLYALDPDDGSTIWRSSVQGFNAAPGTMTFLPNGDIITSGRGPTAAGNGTTAVLHRVDASNGDILWSTDDSTWSPPGTGGNSAVVSLDGQRIYVWDLDNDTLRVKALDAATGLPLYTSGDLTLLKPSFNFAQQAPVMVGPDGTVYAPRLAAGLFALQDTGEDFIEKWRYVPITQGAFSTNAVGPDGSVYVMGGALAPEGFIQSFRLDRLDPATGQVMHSFTPNQDFRAPRMAVDADGKVYLSDSEVRLYCLTPDLSMLWMEFVGSIREGGPVLVDRTLVVQGTGNILRAYRTDASCLADLTGSSDPNDPSYGEPDGDADGDDFFFYLDAFSAGELAICDLTGSSDPNDAGFGTPDGDCDGDDFFFYLDAFSAGCD
ncbi:MAG: GC-type dockerin domain-anchored protein [Phycisphaerales bacterium JB037]